MADDKARADRVIKEIAANMVEIPRGTFDMGDDFSEYDDEKPVHKVTVSAFRISRYQVTQEQWEAVMGDNPSHLQEIDLPVENVNWDDANYFIKKLNKLTEGGNLEYRLPTEAEWEYACRAENTGEYCFGDDEYELVNYAWYDKNSEKTTHRVGLKRPNVWGLYDMHGNVWEWAADWHGDYPKGEVTDPKGPKVGSARMLRGGSCNLEAQLARSAFRSWYVAVSRIRSFGFRLAASEQQGKEKNRKRQVRELETERREHDMK
jgi:formylglycine-generating enzyme required for sulfatase activity